LFSHFSSALIYTRGIALLAVLAAPAHAQQPGTDVRNEVFVGSEMEAYLRVLQVGGQGGLYPWSLRGFSPAEVDRILPADSAHPWMEHHPLRPDSAEGARVSFVRPRAGVTYNSAFPYGQNDGPVWAGRGLTTSLQAGVALRYGRFSATLAPMVFWAENREFPLEEPGPRSTSAFADATYGRFIDHPQRFGDEPYARVDPGQSTLRMDAGGVALGISSANQQWGPVRHQPVVLGHNAPGFVHAFLGTSRPAGVGIGRVHGRLVWGRLEQSAHSSMSADSSGRLLSGLVAVFVPRGAPGVEIGLARLHHTPWAADGFPTGSLLLPLEAFLKVHTRDPLSTDPTRDRNQIASAFFRAAFPASGVEVYGEFGREDHNWDSRDLLLEPDHSSAYVLGLTRVWRPSPTRMLALNGEVANAQVSHLARVRPETGFYPHERVRQGHTHRGQLLGSPAIYGGAGSVVAADYFHPGGRWSLTWRRTLRQDPAEPRPWTPEVKVRHPESRQALGGEVLRLYGRWELLAGMTVVYNRNRYFRGGDLLNLNATFQVSSGF
jgi:hypothetical protein